MIEEAKAAGEGQTKEMAALATITKIGSSNLPKDTLAACQELIDFGLQDTAATAEGLKARAAEAGKPGS